MKTISTRSPASKTPSGVARYIDLQLDAIKPFKTAGDVADEAGFPQRNILSMIRVGQTKLPFERLPGLAKALEVNPGHLFRMALQEYMPAVSQLVEEHAQHPVSANERRLLTLWREATGDEDPRIEQIEPDIRALGERVRNSDLAAARKRDGFPDVRKR